MTYIVRLTNLFPMHHIPDKNDITEVLDAFYTLENQLSVLLMESALTMPRFRVMAFIENHQSVTLSDISAALKITNATASVLAKELLKAELIFYKKNPDDARSKFIELTSNGRDRYYIASDSLQKLYKSLTKKIPSSTVKAGKMFFREMKMQFKEKN